MTKYSFNQAVPFVPTHVGELLKDELDARNMKQSELSELTGIQKPILNAVIKGKRALTPEMALLIESALDVPATLLMNVQTQYRLDCAKLSERVVQQTKVIEALRQKKDNEGKGNNSSRSPRPSSNASVRPAVSLLQH